MENEYNFKSKDIESEIPTLVKKGITEFNIHDAAIACDKKRVLKIISLLKQYAPEIFVSVLIDAAVVDKDLINAASGLFISLDIPLKTSEKGGKLLFDKKFYTSKAKFLNSSDIIYGFQLNYAETQGDTLKLFMDRLDFAVNQYPNHIDFPQTENNENGESAKVSGIFSAQDIRYARNVAFACRTFYSAGRAVPWFLSILKPLRIYPSRFFADFAEWQRVNNCDYKSGFVPEGENHKSIEKMQLLFLEQKYEEKQRQDLLNVVTDVVVLNGAISRLTGEGEESTIKTSYNPNDLLSEEAFDLSSFAENVCMENCSLSLKMVNGEPDFIIN